MSVLAIPRPRAAAALRVDRHELSGAFGDSGVLFPLAASLIAVNGLNPTVVFTGAGVLYVASALYFRVPMPVQPLKAFSAIAIAFALPPQVIAAGALILGAAFLALAATGLIRAAGRVIPVAVVKGIQVALGIALLRSAWDLAQRPQGVPALADATLVAGASVPAGLLLAAGGLAIVLVLLRWRFAPASLVVLGTGACVALFGGSALGPLALGPVAPTIVVPALADWWIALTLLAIPQLPLSIGNAMVSTEDVARSYFGRGASRVTATRSAVSMGLANLAVGLFAGMPLCHGAGGLTAHHRLGARTAAATLTIGAVCLAIGLVLGGSALEVITRGVPPAFLGALLAYVGWEHLQLSRALRGRSQWVTCLAVAAVATAAGNLAAGVVVGIAASYGAPMARSLRETVRGRTAREV
ncbi:MAG TPA: putative sulfate/molybdate transporter [Candidatus Limnocylindria bacterium]|nr:putative sulfate/molybdate transporter [Candidatus Limnocylindria bacterium]